MKNRAAISYFVSTHINSVNEEREFTELHWQKNQHCSVFVIIVQWFFLLFTFLRLLFLSIILVQLNLASSFSEKGKEEENEFSFTIRSF